MNGLRSSLRQLVRDRDLLVLLLLPIVLLALDSSWIFSGPHRDSWIYYGYFQDAPVYAHLYPDHYYSSRLSVILPGFLFHHLLSPVAANLALHLGLYWAAVLSFYLVAKTLFGRGPALIAAVALGCHPYFLFAAGWNYVDGFGIAYFMVTLLFLTLAAQSHRWPVWLVLAGAAAVALVTANLFYAVLLPWLAAHFLVLQRASGRPPLLRDLLFAGAGAAGLFGALGAVNRAFGGPFFYLLPSLRFSMESLGQPNIFRDPTYSWAADATWLVFPALTLLGSLALLLRARRRTSELRQDRFLVYSQVLFVTFTLLIVLLQVSEDMALLQYFYYASLLLPFAFTAFAGQIAWTSREISPKAFALLALLTVFLHAAPLLFRLDPYRLYSLPGPSVLVPLAAGAGVIGVLALGGSGLRTALAVVFFLGFSQFLVQQLPTILRQHDWIGRDGRGLFRQLDHSIAAIHRHDGDRQIRLWYDMDDKNGLLFDAVASAYLLCPHMVNNDFPRLDGGRMCDATQLGPGATIAVLSSRATAFGEAVAALREIGLSGRLLESRKIPGPAAGFTITFLEAIPDQAPRPSSSSSSP